MGVLDDAIRQHLELKRQHGAPETEVSQQEAEALGPARGRAGESKAEAEPVEDRAAVDAAAVEQPADPDAEPMVDPEPVGERPEPGPAPAPEQAEPDWGFEQVDDPPPADETGEDDVLEETPDFLQETPEHDRLWFEQKPPRDFDFDE